jgi:hypothetical protein
MGIQNQYHHLLLWWSPYGREARLPMNKNDNRITLVKRIKEIMEDLPKIRWQIKKNIEKSQEK